jgi:hypothetical protein
MTWVPFFPNSTYRLVCQFSLLSSTHPGWHGWVSAVLFSPKLICQLSLLSSTHPVWHNGSVLSFSHLGWYEIGLCYLLLTQAGMMVLCYLLLTQAGMIVLCYLLLTQAGMIVLCYLLLTKAGMMGLCSLFLT